MSRQSFGYREPRVIGSSQEGFRVHRATGQVIRSSQSLERRVLTVRVTLCQCHIDWVRRCSGMDLRIYLVFLQLQHRPQVVLLSVPVAGLRLHMMCARVHRVTARATLHRPNGNCQGKSHTFLHLRKQARAKGHTARSLKRSLMGRGETCFLVLALGASLPGCRGSLGFLVFGADLCSFFAPGAPVPGLCRPPARPGSVPAFWGAFWAPTRQLTFPSFFRKVSPSMFWDSGPLHQKPRVGRASWLRAS